MLGGRFRKPFEVIAAFQHRNHPALRGLVGDLHDFAGGPAEVLFDELEIGEWIALVCVEARRNDDELGAEGCKPGQNTRIHRRLELVATIASPKWRIDDIVVFSQLTKDQIANIIDVQLEKLRKNLEERGITIDLTDSARELLVAEGYDPVYGARPLKRAIQSLIQNPLAVKLLNGEIGSGQTVRVTAENGEMKFAGDSSAEARA